MVFVVTDGNEGHYTHVDVLNDDTDRWWPVLLAKTFDGLDAAWGLRAAHRPPPRHLADNTRRKDRALTEPAPPPFQLGAPAANDRAVADGGRLLSAYHFDTGDDIWILTEAAPPTRPSSWPANTDQAAVGADRSHIPSDSARRDGLQP
ncbi:MAG: hypothetical protein QOF30_2554 [Acidimicrobiaceae bacterium]|nr:hypothetical protein [Acidimicrobiaceae bacterium]